MFYATSRIGNANRRAFSLVELLVVTTVIAALLGLLISAVQRVRAAAARSVCQNNLKQFALACRNYADNTKKRLPPGGFGSYINGDNRGSWLVHVLPYIDQANLAAAIGNPKGVDSVGKAIANGVLPVPLGAIGRCPADEFDWSSPICNYVGSVGPQCVAARCGSTGPFAQYCNPPASWNWGYKVSPPYGNSSFASDIRGVFNRYGATIRLDMIVDGLSNTLMIGETLPYQHAEMFDTNNWAHQNGGNAHATTIVPINYECGYHDPTDPCANPLANYSNTTVSWGFRSRHKGGANFAFADGSVHFLKDDIDPRTYNLLGCRNDQQDPGPYE